MTTTRRINTIVSLVMAALVLGPYSNLQAQQGGPWQKEKVAWEAGGGRRIKAIHYPKDKRPPQQMHGRRVGPKKGQPSGAVSPKAALEALGGPGDLSVLSLDVNNPPIDGFVPWIAVGITKERKTAFELDAEVQSRVVGSYPRGVNPLTDYMIGIFDTGASAHVIGYRQAQRAGLNGDLLTTNQNTVYGVVGAVEVWVSQPLALFVDGLGAVDPNTLVLNTAAMMGESNVSVMVGDDPLGAPDLSTAVGTPLSVYFTAEIRNDRVRTIVRDGQTYTGPDVRLFEPDDPCIPSYPNMIPLELRPLGSFSVQYIPVIPDVGNIDDWFSEPAPSNPSIIVGNSAQSLFFVASVDLYEGNKVAMDKNRFMLDTGAQVTVIGSRIAARLGLSPANKEFEVEIQDVTGEVVMAPGFYVDSIEIPAVGEWLTARTVPVVLLDVFSPEGGTLDGIIGTNLFVDFNLVLRGGGMFFQPDPALEFAPIEADLQAGAAQATENSHSATP